MKIDLQHVSALGICADCDGTIPVTEHGRCAECGSDSVIRPFSLAYRLSRRPRLDKRFLRGKRIA